MSRYLLKLGSLSTQNNGPQMKRPHQVCYSLSESPSPAGSFALYFFQPATIPNSHLERAIRSMQEGCH